MKNYIAYGSNMDLAQMAHRCPDAELLGTGMLVGWELLFKGSLTGSYATIERKAGAEVPVLLWRVSKEDEERLDRYEGFPHFYYKKTVAVAEFAPLSGHSAATSRRRGMAYVMHEERKLGLPSEDYFLVLADAYEKFGFDLNILRQGVMNSRPSFMTKSA